MLSHPRRIVIDPFKPPGVITGVPDASEPWKGINPSGWTGVICGRDVIDHVADHSFRGERRAAGCARGPSLMVAMIGDPPDIPDIRPPSGGGTPRAVRRQRLPLATARGVA
jgi:hypothetical protein